MRKILVTAFAAVAACTSLFPQSPGIDSLKALLQVVKSDTARVLIFRDLSTAYRQNLQYDLALDAATRGLELARQSKYKRGEAALLNAKGTFLSGRGYKADALKLWLQALHINEELGELEGISRNLNNIANYYSATGHGRTALSYWFRAQAAWEQADKAGPGKRPVPYILSNIGEYYLGLKMYDSAKFYIDRYYELGRAQNNASVMADGLTYLGNIYSAMKEYEIAVAYYRSALSLAETLDVNLADIWLSIAEMFEKKGEVDSALYYGRKSTLEYIRNQLPAAARTGGRFMARLYEQQNNKDSALHYLQIATIAMDTLKAREQIAEVTNALFDEKFREEEKMAAAKEEDNKRKENLQYAAIALALVSFLIIFLVFSHSIMANQKLIRFLGGVALLMVFEFLNLLLHPWLGSITHHSPVLMLLSLAGVAALLIPLHHRLEHWMTHRLVERNKKIRLSAAKKTIAELEGERAGGH